MRRKILLCLGASLAVIVSAAAFSAFEAHVINVTAHIENALNVDTTPIEFGTVFPQEYLEKTLTINLSDSFLLETNADDVEYIIKQKPKCICDFNPTPCPLGEYTPIDYATHQCPIGYHEMLSLCPFLSKMDGDLEDNNDIGVPSYYQGTSCVTPDPDYAVGRLAKSEDDTSDIWIIDLKVPPVTGYVGQDWPVNCPVVDEDSRDYGCDLWVEVTGISRFGEENGSEKERACIASGGTVATSTCCLATSDFPDTCSVGACGCAPQNSHEVKICNCGPDRCFNGTTCVDECTPTTEICDNGVDDDCDGDIDCADIDCAGDDACIAPECTNGDIRSCYTGSPSTRNVGLCQDGTQTCVTGSWGSCIGDTTPVAEICDGEDNDCDGSTDEGNPGGGDGCDTGESGICAAGTLQCTGGSLQCVQNNYPETEICDGVDNDCDGTVDEGCPSPNGWLYEQNFNSLADGDLPGQDGWTGYNEFDVQSTVAYEGTKAVQGIRTAGAVFASRSVPSSVNGTVYFAMRSTANNSGDFAFALKDNNKVDAHAMIKFDSDGNIKTHDNINGWQTITAYSANTWYIFRVEYDCGNDRFRVKVYDSSWSGWYPSASTWYNFGGDSGDPDDVNLLWMYVSNLGQIAYFDTITPTDPTTP